MSNKQVVNKDDIVVRFVGDCGDGMQFSGSLFSDTAALSGNDIATFPDYPAEIRAPHNTIAGVSGFQVHLGAKIHSSGDKCDIIVAMNPASLRANLKWAKIGATIIIDIDAFTADAIEKAGYKNDPLSPENIGQYNIIKAPISSQTKAIGTEKGLDARNSDKCRNMFALGMIFYICNKSLEVSNNFLAKKFAKNPLLVEANQAV